MKTNYIEVGNLAFSRLPNGGVDVETHRRVRRDGIQPSGAPLHEHIGNIRPEDTKRLAAFFSEEQP